LAGLVSVAVRDGGWSALGFRRPESWLRLIFASHRAGCFVIEPLAARWWPADSCACGDGQIAGNIKIALLWLLIIGDFRSLRRRDFVSRLPNASRGECRREIYRRFLAGNTPGVGALRLRHYYNGPTGISSSSVAGFISATAYLLTGRNLWAPVLAHGFIDTVRTDRRLFRMGRVRTGKPRHARDITICISGI